MGLGLNAFSTVAHTLVPGHTGPAASFNLEVVAAQAKSCRSYSVLFSRRFNFFKVDGVDREVWVDGFISHGFCGVSCHDTIGSVGSVLIVVNQCRGEWGRLDLWVRWTALNIFAMP